MDFDDLLLQTNILLRDCPDVLERYQEQFKYILVDEYQDTNYAQYIIVRRLSQHHGKVCVVGDDAQSIYSFRGAKIENILSFQRDYPEAKVFKLEQNYRSTRTIVEAANSVIVHNSRRMEKRCFSEGDEGEKIRVLKAYTDREEAELVVQDLRDKVRATGDAWNEAAILYRTNNQSQALEESLRRRGIPYRIYKGASFYDRKEIKDMLAYIRLVVNPRDDEAFRRIVNYPARGIGDTTVLRIAQLAAERGVSMWEAVDALVAEPVSDPVQRTIVRKVAEFVALIRSLSLERAQKGLYDFGMEVASRSGILALFRRENSPEATSALDNIEELLNSMQLFKEQRDAEIRGGEELGEATVEEWLQSVTLTTDMDKKGGRGRRRQGDAHDRPFGQGVGVQIRLHRRDGGEPLPVAAGRRVARGFRRGAAPVLRGPHARQMQCGALLCRDAVQVGQHGVFASELFPARDRPPLSRRCGRGRPDARARRGRSRRPHGARRAAPAFRRALSATGGRQRQPLLRRCEIFVRRTGRSLFRRFAAGERRPFVRRAGRDGFRLPASCAATPRCAGEFAAAGRRSGTRRRERRGVGLCRRRAGRASQVRVRGDRAYRNAGGRS